MPKIYDNIENHLTKGLNDTLELSNRTDFCVKQRVSENLQQNNERVTKRFYDSFKREHASFLSFIKGIEDKVSKDWYASLMLNRLMFCYFIQKKGFLDNNKNYLRDKLKACQEKKGKNKFYSFYRNFLLFLFHHGLGAPEHSKELKEEIGIVPYLNGGLFEEHELEKENEVNIDDRAFESIFDFFDQYEWHLDTRIASTGRDINPDVIGYIFEKYINDRAQMGAYYTKEDITEYISKNCVLPYLFDEVKRQYPKAFMPSADIWNMLKASGDEYIYDAVKYGINTNSLWGDTPEEIIVGLNIQKPNLLERRKEWNKPAPSNVALPTETWRELIERRKRYSEVKAKIENGEINNVNDFITYNLNITQFFQNIIENTNDPELIKYFYKTLNNITILDPTCGSGAFLFAAMNILEPLYEGCIQRMDNFVRETQQGKYKFFEEILSQVKSPSHPNLPYFIYKNIILNNLYGVDIMKEAVEIAKLRLFLKLVATVDADYRKPNLGLEPLPDVDFNIRIGNTLIGFTNEDELKNVLVGNLFGREAQKKIKEKCDIVAKAFTRYKEIQLSCGDDFTQYKKAKEELNKRLKELNNELNIFLSQTYKIDIKNKKQFHEWLNTHVPFHWFSEFYEIIHDKDGFDVVIGNPPYVEYSKVRNTYKIHNYETEKCCNLYGFVIERSNFILNKKGLMGMIVPINAFSNLSMETLQKLFKNFPLSYVSNFHQRPAALFEGVLQRLSIFVLYKENQKKEINSTKIYRWKSEIRSLLFSTLHYTSSEQNHKKNLLKIGSILETSIFRKYLEHKEISNYLSGSNEANNKIYYRTAGGGYWVTVLNSNFDTSSLSNKDASFQRQYNSKVFTAILNSNLFWWYYSINFDQFNFKDYMIFGFRFDYPTNKTIEQNLIKLSDKLEKELLANATTYVITSKTRGSSKTITYNKYLSKVTMNTIDGILAEHYGFTDEELDFIINYDIKYRMGKELEDETL